MMDFLNLKPVVFGLDVSDLSLKIIKLKRRRRFLSLASFGETEIKPGIIEKGEIKSEKEFLQVLKEALNKVKGERLKTHNVIVSLPEKKAFFTVIQMPRMKEEELQSAVPFEAENHIPLPIEEVYLDFQIIPPVQDHLDHFDILLACFPRNIINIYVSCLKKAGLDLYALEIESQSISRALIKNGLSPFPILIVDFGRSVTNFIIFSGYSIRFTASTPISSFQLNQAISKSLGVDLKEAEKMKIKYGLELTEDRERSKTKSNSKEEKITRKDIFESMAPVLSDLTDQIKKYINYYQTHSCHEHLSVKKEGIEKIILCGKGANLKGLANFLSLFLEMPVELGNPWTNILPDPLREVPELPFGESLGYTTALGLALRGIKEE